MKRLRHLLALLLAVLLLAGSVPAWATESNGVLAAPPAWTSTQTYDWYTALSAETERSVGIPVTQNFTFEVKANVAKLTVVNDGIFELDLAVNGQRFNLNTFFEKAKGTASFDISDFITYGVNTLEVQSLGTPNATATITVEAPAYTARILHTNDIHANIDPLPKMAAYVKAAKAQGGDVFFVDAGDNFSGNPVSDLNQGKPMIEILNGMQLDLFTMGNHDFDHGPANTQARREESSFPWLSANTVVVDPALTPIQPFQGYLIKENELGQKIGFIALTQTPPATGAKNTVGLQFTDPVAAAQALIAELRPQVNLLVLVSHNGNDWDIANAPNFAGIDLILGAHSHTSLIKPTLSAGIPIIQVGSSAASVSDLLLRQANTVAVAPGAVGSKYTVATKDMTAVDPSVQATVTYWKELMAPTLNTKIGYNNTALTATGSKTTSDIGLGSLIADGLRDYMNAEIGVWNNGGIRADLPKGDITMNSIYKVLPFGNIPWKVEATGAQIVQLLANSFKKYNNIDLQISGATYAAYTKADGTLDHIALWVGGQPVDPARTYTLALSDYVATSKQYWSTIPTPVEMASEVDAIAVAEYVKKLGTVNYKSGSEGRIRIVTPPAPPTAVSKLNFYNSSSLLAAGEGGVLVPLTTQAKVLVTGEVNEETGESTAYQVDRNTTSPKNFTMVDAGKPVPLLAMQDVGGGRVVASGAILVANGYRTAYQNPQYFTNLLDYLTGTASGTVLFDEGHGQYYGFGSLTSIADFIQFRGYTPAFTGADKALTAALLQDVKVLVITTPGAVGAYTDAELAVLQSYVAGGGNVILLSQTDFNNNSNPTEFNRIAEAIGTVIRFNSDEIRDDASKDGTTNYSPVTDQFSAAYPELLKVR